MTDNNRFAIMEQFVVAAGGNSGVAVYRLCDDHNHLCAIADALGFQYSRNCESWQLAAAILDEYAVGNGELFIHGDFAIAKRKDKTCTLYQKEGRHAKEALLKCAKALGMTDGEDYSTNDSEGQIAAKIVNQAECRKHLSSILKRGAIQDAIDYELTVRPTLEAFETHVAHKRQAAILIDPNGYYTRERIESLGDFIYVDVAQCKDQEALTILHGIMMRYGTNCQEDGGVFFDNCYRVPEIPGKQKIEELITCALTGGAMQSGGKDIDFSKLAVGARSRKYPHFLPKGTCPLFILPE